VVIGCPGPRARDINKKKVIAHCTCMQGDWGNHQGNSNGLYEKDSKDIDKENGMCLCNTCKANDLWVSVNCYEKLNFKTKVQNDAKFHQSCRLEAANVLNCTS